MGILMAINFTTHGSVGVKALIIGAIVLVLLIPLTMLRGLVSERAQRRDQAYSTVAQGWGGDLVVGGPMLVIPTERVVAETDIRTRTERSEIYLLPAKLDMDVQLALESEPRYVGIYAVPVYLAHVRMTGQFDFESLRPLLNRPGVKYLWDQSRVQLPLSDVRRLRELQQVHLDQSELKFGPARGSESGVEAPVATSILTNGLPVSFDFSAVLAGSRSFSVLPLGSDTTVTLQSNWPHPSFQGAFLPVDRKITDNGFKARWQVLELNRSYGQAWEDSAVAAATLSDSAFGVNLYQAVDVYQCGERAIKYALLFIALTFLTFFAWERVSRLRIHPLQYLLIGFALSVFYLLLIALSEHLVFALAYAAASVALISLIGIYLAGALKSRTRGAIAAGVMTLVYGLLYMLVLSEDYALLLGAIILFTALSVVMLMTRRLDWYGDAEGVVN
jgi:inner membrane protein